jgi:hypothetical protein
MADTQAVAGSSPVDPANFHRAFIFSSLPAPASEPIPPSSRKQLSIRPKASHDMRSNVEPIHFGRILGRQRIPLLKAQRP